MSSEQLPAGLREALAVFDDAAPRSAAEVADRLDVGRRATYDRLERLAERGALRSKTVGASARVWWCPPAAGDDPGADAARERELEEYRSWNRTLVENFPNGAVATVDSDMRYVTFGGTPGGDTELTRRDLEGEPVREALPPELAEVVVPRYEAALDGEPARFEERVDDRVYQFHFVPVRDDDGEVFAVTATSQDVTERRERERELRTRVRQQEVVTELGQHALERDDLDALLAEAAERVATVLGTDYCKVLDLDAVGEELALRHGVGWQDGVVGSATVSATDDDSQAAYTLRSEAPVVVEDLSTETRFGGPDLLTDHDVLSGVSTIIGSTAEPWGILGAHDTDRREFAAHDVNFVQSVANILASAIARHEYEQVLVRRRVELAALNELYEVLSGITDAVIEQSRREEIEATVVDRLGASTSYRSAWVGDVDPASGRVRVHAEARTGDGLDDETVSVDPNGRDPGPTAAAVRDGEVRVAHDLGDEPWCERVAGGAVRSAAAIPIEHERTSYGVVTVYTGRADAFGDRETTILEQFGEVVGHAIAATERKQALMSDEVVDLEFRVPDVFETFGVECPTAGRIDFDTVIPIGDEEYLLCGRATDDAVEAVRAMVDAVPHWETVAFRTGERESSFEARVSEPPVLSAVASVGGAIRRAVVEDGDYRMTIHLSPSVPARQVIDVVEEAYPSARLSRRQRVTRPEADAPLNARDVLTADLTERQRGALEAAFHAGFFERPRRASGEAVADLLDVAPSTFHQHLRRAEQTVFAAMLDDDGSAAMPE